MSEKLNSDYLKNEKSFYKEIKIFFLISKMLFFRHTKHASKNLADTTFKVLLLQHFADLNKSDHVNCLRVNHKLICSNISLSEQGKQMLETVSAFLNVFRLNFLAQNFPDKYMSSVFSF